MHLYIHIYVPFNKLLKNKAGFCRTMTLPAADNVHNVIHITNLAGRNTRVGKPINTAKIPNNTDIPRRC
jgi:hypothetical protein